MDLLFKRYASPFSITDGYIQTGRFTEFVRSFVKFQNEDDRWEYFLHKVFNQTYSQFCESLQVTQDLQSMTDDDLSATIRESMNILGNFRPDEEEGEH